MRGRDGDDSRWPWGRVATDERRLRGDEFHSPWRVAEVRVTNGYLRMRKGGSYVFDPILDKSSDEDSDEYNSNLTGHCWKPQTVVQD